MEVHKLKSLQSANAFRECSLSRRLGLELTLGLAVGLGLALVSPALAQDDGTQVAAVVPTADAEGAVATDSTDTSAQQGQRRKGPGPRKGALRWKGTANDGSKDMPARMYLNPPRKGGPGGQGQDGAVADDAAATDTTATDPSAKPRRPLPGELRIGNRVLMIKPVSAEVDDAASTDTGSDTTAAPQRPPRLRKFKGELVMPRRRKGGSQGSADGGSTNDDGATASGPKVLGTIEISIDPNSDGSKGATVTGTAVITNPKTGETKTYTLNGKVLPPGGGRRADGAGGDEGADAAASPATDTATADAAAAATTTTVTASDGAVTTSTEGL